MSQDIGLPFDPGERPPDITPTLSDEERASAAVHAHYYHCRQALDLIDTSRYQALLAGADPSVLDAAELRANVDQQLVEDES